MRLLLQNSLKQVLQSTLVALLIAGSVWADDATVDAVDRARQSTVVVRGYNSNGGLSFGSGVVVADNAVITNCHVLRDTRKAWIARGETIYPIVSIKANAWHDLCLLYSEDLHLPVVSLGSSEHLQARQSVVAIGHSYGAPRALVAAGRVQASYPFDGAKIIKTNARFAIGASGSGIFDLHGHLVGINTFKTPGRSAFFYALPVEWVAALAEQKNTSPLPVHGAAFWDSDEQAKPYFMQVAMPEIYGEWTVALAIAKNWTQAEPLTTEAWHSLGLAFTHLGREQDAEMAYRHALSLDQQHLESWVQLGLLSHNQQNAIVQQEIVAQLTKLGHEILAEYQHELTEAGTQTNRVAHGARDAR